MAAWHPALARVGGAYALAILFGLRPIKDWNHERWWTDHIVVTALLWILFYSPAVIAWMLTRRQDSKLLTWIIWCAAFLSTTFPPWWVVRFLQQQGIPIISPRAWYLYFGELTALGHFPVLYGGAFLAYGILPIVQSWKPSYRTRLASENGKLRK